MPRFATTCFRLARFASLLGAALAMRANPPAWSGGTGHASDNSKWTTSTVPTVTDTVTVTSGSVTFDNDTTFGALLLSGGDLNGNASLTLGNVTTSSWSGGSLSFANGHGVSVSTGATLSVNGNGSFHDFAGTAITNSGTFDWSAGQLRTGSSGSITNNGTFKDSASDSISNDLGGATGNFNNAGSYNKNASGTTTVGLSFANTGNVNLNAGTLSLNGGGSNASGAKVVIGAGTTLKFGGGSFAFASANDITDGGGTIEFSGGTTTFGGGSVAVGNVTVSGGTVNFTSAGGTTSNALTVANGTLASGTYSTSGYNQSGGSVTGANVNLAGAGHSWTGGDMDGNGTLTLWSGASLDINTSSIHDFSQHTIANGGTINWSTGEMRTGSGGGVNNNGIFNDTASNSIDNGLGGAQGQFNNAGTYNKSGPGTTNIGLTFTNTGSVHVNSGTLELSGGGSNTAGSTIAVSEGAELRLGGGSYSVDSANDITATGATVTFSGGAVTFGNGTLTATNLAVAGGTVAFTHGGGNSGTLSVSNGVLASGSFKVSTYTHSGGSVTGANVEVMGSGNTWSGGDMDGSGTLTIDGGASLDITTSSIHDFSQHAITNGGTINWSTGELRTGSSGAVNNNGVFNDTASNSIDNSLGGSMGHFNNAGTYNKSGTGTSTIGIDFENTGNVSVGNGTLELSGGGTNASGAKINVGAGNGLKFSGGTFTIASAADIVDNGGTYTFAGGTTTFTSGNTILGNIAVSGGTVGFAAGGATSDSLTLTNGVLASGNFTTASYAHSGGSATGASVHVTGGNAHWSGGDMDGTGSLTLDNTVSLTIDTASYHDFSQHTINNNGNVTWSYGQLRTGSSGAVTNNGTFTDAASDRIANDLGGSQSTFSNAGTYHKTAAGTTTMGLTFANHGATNVDAGTLQLTGGGAADGSFTTAANATTEFAADYTLNSGATLNGAGKYSHSGGTLNVAGTLGVQNLAQTGGTLSPTGTLTVGNLTLTGGTLGGATGSEVVVTGNMTWTGAADMNGSGKTTIGSGVALTIDDTTGNTRNFSGHEIVNNGTVNWNSAYLQTGQGGKFTNASGGTFNDNNGSSYHINNAYAGSSSFENNGTYVRDAGGTTYVDTAFNNSGTVHVKNGDMQFHGGGTLATGGTIQADSGTNVYFTNDYTVNDAAALTGSGTFWLTGGTLTANGTFNASTFRQTNGSLAGSNTLKGNFTWSGGDWNTSVGAGGTHPSTTIDASATLNLTDANGNGRNFDARQVVNNGTVNWNSGYIQSGHGGTFTNASGATFNDTNASSYSINAAYGSGFTFTNNGSYIRDAGGTTYLETTFNNTGSVHVKNGAMEFHGGGTMDTGATIQADSGTNVYFTNDYTVNDAAALTGSGTFWLTGGTLTANGTFNASTFRQTNGSLAGSNTLKGNFTWSGGDWNTSVGAGGPHPSTTIDASATLNLTDANGNGRNFDARQVVNNGTVNWNSGYIQSGHGGSFTNASGATFNDTNASSYSINAAYGNGFTFTNNGTYSRDATGTTYFATTFNNNGTLNLKKGDIQIQQGGTMSASSVTNVSSGAHLYFTNDYTLADGAQLHGAGLIDQIAGTLTINGTLLADALVWSGGNWNAAAGSGATTTIDHATTLNLTDANDHGRNFDARAIVNHGTVNWNSGYIQSGHGGSFTNAADGTFYDLNSPGYSINAAYGSGFVFTNNGTYVRNTSGTTYLATTFNNNGTLNLQQGDIQIQQGGTMGATSVTNVSSGAHLYFTNDYTLADGAQLHGNGLINQIAGTLTINGTLLADSLVWSGGNWNAAAGAGATTTIDHATTLNLADTNDHGRNFDARAIVNHGTVNWNSGYIQSGDGGSFTNASDGTFYDLNSPGYSINAAYGNGFVFTNNGTYVRNTTGTTYLATTFNNNGTLNLQQGDIQIQQGGTMGATSVANVSSGAHLYFTNDYTLADGAQLHGKGLINQIAGTLTINGTLVADSFVWSGGNWNATAGAGATTTIDPATTLEITDANDHGRNFDARAIINHGTVNWHSGYLESGHGGSFTNAADGTFNDLNSPGYTVNAAFGSGFTFTNQGTYVRNTSGTTYFATTFDNDGTLNLQQGDIQIQQGGTMGAKSIANVSTGAHLYFTNDYTIADGAQFHGAGLVDQIGGTLTINGHLAADSFVWSGGNWNAAAGSGATTTIASGSTLTLSDANDHGRNFDARTILNHGTVNWNSGYIQSGHGGAFTNASDGVFNDLNSPGYSMENPFGGAFSFNNNGVYNKSTSGTTTVDVPFTNGGTLNVTGGRMVFNGTFTNNGSLVLANGAAAQFANSLSFTNTFLGGTGTITAPAVTAGGTVSPGNSPGMLAITGDFTLLNTSVLLIELGGTTQGTQYDYLNVGGNVTLGGLLDIKFVNGFGGSILATDQFTILSAGGTSGLSGAFANVASGGRLSTIDGLGSFQVNYNGVNSVTLTNFQPVPEPSTYVLLSGGLLAVYACLRRRRRG